MELVNKHFVGDFLGFTYNGIHSSTLGLVRVSAGNRYTKNLFPAFTNKTVQPEGKDGFYYFGAYYTNNQMQVDTAFDNLNEEQFQKLSTAFSCKQFKELWFDETPYKAYWAKLSESPQIKYLCFTGDDGQRVYKGELILKFEILESWAHNRVVTWEDNIDIIRQIGSNVKNEAFVIEGLMEDLIGNNDTQYKQCKFRKNDQNFLVYYVDLRVLEDFKKCIKNPIVTKFNYLYEEGGDYPYSAIVYSGSGTGKANEAKRPLYYNFLKYELTDKIKKNGVGEVGKLCESFNFKDWADTIPVNIENNNYGVKEGDYILKFKIFPETSNGRVQDALYRIAIFQNDGTQDKFVNDFIVKIKGKIFGEEEFLYLYIDSKKKIVYTLNENKKNIINIVRKKGDIFTLPLGEYKIKISYTTNLEEDDVTGWDVLYSSDPTESNSNLIELIEFSNDIQQEKNGIIKPYYYFY